MKKTLNILNFFIALIFLTGSVFAQQATIEKISKPGEYSGWYEISDAGYEYSSFYITMPDSVKIAVDLYLPKEREAGEVPTILELTRYTRSLRLRWPFSWIKGKRIISTGSKETMEYYCNRGYAMMVVDARGSGASFGTRKMEFSPKEIRDISTIADWIIAQPWSNGNIGVTDVSYSGTTAELILTNNHPAIKAAIPQNAIFDLYEDIVYPGGVRHSPFIELWGGFTLDMDQNIYDRFGRLISMAVKGVNHVDEDQQRKMIAQAYQQHQKNYDIFSELRTINYRDDENKKGDKIDEFSVHSKIVAINESDVPIYRITGWYDGALVYSAVKGYLSVDNPTKMLLGPWDHGTAQNISPHIPGHEVTFKLDDEMIRFFDYHLKGIDNGIMNEPPVRYYTIGEEKWKYSETWPLAGEVRTKFYLHDNHQLATTATAGKNEFDSYEVDYTHSTGGGSRWNSLTALYRYEKEIGYPDRKEQDEKCIVYESEPLAENVEVTGHPTVSLQLAADATDATVFVYLEEVTPTGEVIYTTEGMLRAIHRKEAEPYGIYKKPGIYHTFKEEDSMPLTPKVVTEYKFDLQPLSYEFQKGSKIRVSIAGADEAHFDPPADKPSQFQIYHSDTYASFVELPFILE